MSSPDATGFTVIVPVHNKLPHLERSIGSVLGQTHGNFELIVVDDASTDGSYERLLTFDDPRLRIMRREVPGPGGYAARNLGVLDASHPWVCFLDADDEWHPDFLSTVHGIRMDHPRAEVVSTGWAEGTSSDFHDAPLESSDDPEVTSFELIDYISHQRIVHTNSITMSRELFGRAGGFPTDPAATRGGDIDTFVRCLWHARSCIRTEQVLAYYYRDTVNRVTDLRRDARPVIPALGSLAEIRSQTDDPALRKAIDHFTDQLIYTRLWRSVSMGLPLDTRLLRKMRPTPYGAARTGKLLLHRSNARLRSFRSRSSAPPHA